MLKQEETFAEMCYQQQESSGLEVGKGCQELSTIRTKSCNTRNNDRVFIESLYLLEIATKFQVREKFGRNFLLK